MAHPIIVITENKPKLFIQVDYLDDQGKLKNHHKKRIEEIEAQIARDEAALHDPDLYARDPKKFAALTTAIEKARAERDAAEERWLELAEQLEALAS